MKQFLNSFILLLVVASNTWGQGNVFDIIPSDLGATLAITNLDDLRKKGDVFLKETDIHTFRLSDGFNLAVLWLGINQGVDYNNAAALTAAVPNDEDTKLQGMDNFLVLTLPFDDLDKMAANFNFKPDTFPREKVLKGDGNRVLGHFIMARGNHFYLSNSEKALEAILKSKSLSQTLTKQQQQELGQAQVLMYGSSDMWKYFVKKWEEEYQTKLKNEELDPAEKETAQQLLEAAKSVEHLVMGLHLDGGLGLTVDTLLPKNPNPVVRDVLDRLTGGKGASTLQGLPQGNVLAAMASQGDGARQTVVAKTLLGMMMDTVGWRNLLDKDAMMKTLDRPQFFGLFQELVQRLRGQRLAMYRNADETRHGLYSVMAVLDTQDALVFLRDMRRFSAIALGQGPLGADGNREINIDRLIAQCMEDLGADEYLTRESASTQLRLIGQPAQPALLTGQESKDAEVRRRSRIIWHDIERAAANRREDLLARDVLEKIHPKFTYYPRAEQHAEVNIDVVQLKLEGSDAAHATTMQGLLGSQWDRLRLAIVGQQLIVYLGSDPSLLHSTITNLQTKQPGLAAHSLLAKAPLLKEAERKFEVHISLTGLQRLIKPPAAGAIPKENKADSFSSLGILVEPSRLHFQLFMPYAEVKPVAKHWGW